MENKTKKVEIEIPEGKRAEWVNGVLTLVDEKKQDITERIKTFEDACYKIGFDHPFVNAYYDCIVSNHRKSMNNDDLVAYLKLRIITAALNEGWEPQFTKGEHRWYFWYNLITKEKYDKLSTENKSYVVYRDSNSANAYKDILYGSAFYDASSLTIYIGSRLVFKNQRLAEYAGRQFAEIYADFCFRTKPLKI